MGEDIRARARSRALSDARPFRVLTPRAASLANTCRTPRKLGMDLEKDKDLFYIAKEGLKAPLPENWKPCKTTDTDESACSIASLLSSGLGG
jgi:hypothetical protein